MEPTFFKKLNDLDKNERYWIATLFLKMIYADNKVHVKELPYYNEVFDLLDNDPMMVEAAKTEARDLTLEKCTNILIGYNFTEQLLICLLEIASCDDDFDDREYQTMKETAYYFGYETDRFEELVNQVKNQRL